MLIARDIKWDTDGADPKELGLPDQIIIPEDVESDDEISDYLSDQTGFCHFGYDLIDL